MSLGVAAAAVNRTHQVGEEDGGTESVSWRIRPAQVSASPEGAVTVVMLLLQMPIQRPSWEALDGRQCCHPPKGCNEPVRWGRLRPVGPPTGAPPR